MTTNQGGAAAADYSGVPQSVTFDSGDISRTFTFTAEADNVNDDGESVLLTFGASLPADVTAGTPGTSIVTITDDDVPAVTVSFGAASYAVAEGSSRTVTVELSADPERTVIIPIVTTNQGGAAAADYSGVPTSVTFTSGGDTSRAFTFTAEADDDDDDGESVRLSFGAGLPAGVTAGTPGMSIVSITDDDVPAVTVQFGQSAYTVAEGDDTGAERRPRADGEHPHRDGEPGRGLSRRLLRRAPDRHLQRSRTFTFTADPTPTTTTARRQAELRSGPAGGRTAGTPNTATVSITDDDVPAVTAQFGQSAYTVAEGGTQTVTVILSADPERTVIIPIVLAAPSPAATPP